MPALPGQAAMHQSTRPQRRLPTPRTPRAAGPRPRRAADPRVEGPLRGPLRHRGHRQRIRPRTRHAPLPPPRPTQGTPAARTHRHRSEHRRTQRPAGDRGNPHTETTDRLPDLPGPTRNPAVEALANPRNLTSITKITDRVKLRLRYDAGGTATKAARTHRELEPVSPAH